MIKKDITDYLEENLIEYFILKDSEDILVPEHNYIIRFNHITNQKEVDKYSEEGYSVYTLFPWHDKKKTLDFLGYRLKLFPVKKMFARKLRVLWANTVLREVRSFIGEHHILGTVNHKNPIGCSYLLDDWGKLYGVATFVKRRKGGVELKRMVFNPEYSVVGGASKLMKCFWDNNPEVDACWTFADRDLSSRPENIVYSKIGFERVGSGVNPQEVFYHEGTGKRFSIASLWMTGADRLLANFPGYKMVGIGEDLPGNVEIVESYGFVKYTDAGNYLFKMNNPKQKIQESN